MTKNMVYILYDTSREPKDPAYKNLTLHNQIAAVTEDHDFVQDWKKEDPIHRGIIECKLAHENNFCIHCGQEK